MKYEKDRFDELVASALAQDFTGWDFSYIQNRWREETTAWDYSAIVREQITKAQSLLDMGTGGGEFLASLAPLPQDTHVTEAWQPNIPVAKKYLEPLGINVHGIEEYAPLPFSDDRFDLIINRHEWYNPAEVFRILKPNGMFITQQVGDQNDNRLNLLIAGQLPESDQPFNLATECSALEQAGFNIKQEEEEFPPLHFFDIGAIVYYLKVVEWQIPNFSVERYHDQLRSMHHMIARDRRLTVNQHRFLLVAQKS